MKHLFIGYIIIPSVFYSVNPCLFMLGFLKVYGFIFIVINDHNFLIARNCYSMHTASQAGSILGTRNSKLNKTQSWFLNSQLFEEVGMKANMFNYV